MIKNWHAVLKSFIVNEQASSSKERLIPFKNRALIARSLQLQCDAGQGMGDCKRGQHGSLVPVDPEVPDDEFNCLLDRANRIRAAAPAACAHRSSRYGRRQPRGLPNERPCQ